MTDQNTPPAPVAGDTGADAGSAIPQSASVPDGWTPVPVEFVRGFLTCAHNYSLQAVPPVYFTGLEGDAFKAAYARCGDELNHLKAMLFDATVPQIQADPVLDKPAMVGRGRFGVGVKWSTVIGAAQRLYEYEVTPSKEKVRIKLAQDAMDDLRQFVGVAAADVLAERKRQLEVEGWTPEHDDEHGAGELGRAGGFYALNAGAALHFGTTDTSICDQAPSGWPWEPEWWKPKNSRHDLVKAGALILAEIERLDRAAMASTQEAPQ